MQLSFVLVMQATSSPLAPQVTPEWLNSCALAVEVQLNRDVAPQWGGSYRVRVGAAGDLNPGEVAFAIVDSLADAPGAIAYHDVSVAVSHECAETAGDWACNFWADRGDGTEYALELCDAIESAGYRVNGVAVSDFVLPAFFEPESPGPYSYTGAAKAPFQTAPGGYQITRAATGAVSQVSGKGAPGPRGLRVAAGAHPKTSRPARRGLVPAGDTLPAPAAGPLCADCGGVGHAACGFGKTTPKAPQAAPAAPEAQALTCVDCGGPGHVRCGFHKG